MNPIIKSWSWIPLDRLGELVHLESFLLCVAMSLLCFLVYKGFLRKVSPARHQNFHRYFSNLFFHLVALAIFFVGYSFTGGRLGSVVDPVWTRMESYLGFASLVLGIAVFIKASKILVYEYLVFWNMRAGIPVLIVNIFTLVLTAVLSIWALTFVFQINLAPLLATSAIFSVVLGFALQDTLGNLFAGLSLQFDFKHYQIGDWIEIQSAGSKWLGKVEEISWRATTLVGLLDEKITVPNRVVSQSQIVNYSTRESPVLRVHSYRLGFDVSVNEVKRALLAAAGRAEGVRINPPPVVILAETQESWLLFKLIYSIEDMGAQARIADHVNVAVLEEFSRSNIALATDLLAVKK
jgi:small-conductance mechanosensitive channel